MHKFAITIHERTSWSRSHPNRTENGLQAAPDPKDSNFFAVADSCCALAIRICHTNIPSPTHLRVICALRILVFFQILEQLGVTTLRLGTWGSKPGQTVQWLYWINRFCLKNYLTWMLNSKKGDSSPWSVNVLDSCLLYWPDVSMMTSLRPSAISVAARPASLSTQYMMLAFKSILGCFLCLTWNTALQTMHP